MSTPNHSKLILGTVQFGLQYGINNHVGQISPNDAFRILDYAYDNGIQYLDTASAYGSSEQVIGSYLKSNPQKNFKVITKLHIHPDQSIAKSIQNSLAKLNLKKVDLLMFHSYDDYVAHKDEFLEFSLKNEHTYFNRLGVSVYRNKELEGLVLDKHVDVIQSPFNLLDNNNIRGNCFKVLKEAGKEIHTRSTFLQGLFFKPLSEFPLSLQGLVPAMKNLYSLTEEFDINMEQLAVSYPFTKDYIDGVLIGIDSLGQLVNNVNNLRVELSQELVKRIDSVSVSDIYLLNPSLWKI